MFTGFCLFAYDAAKGKKAVPRAFCTDIKFLHNRRESWDHLGTRANIAKRVLHVWHWCFRQPLFPKQMNRRDGIADG